MIQAAAKQFNTAVAFDDRDTIVRIFTADEGGRADVLIAEGRARRKKGDARDEVLGVALASGRAFQALADREMEYADSILNPPEPEPHQEFGAIFEVALDEGETPEGAWERMMRKLGLIR